MRISCLRLDLASPVVRAGCRGSEVEGASCRVSGRGWWKRERMCGSEWCRLSRGDVIERGLVGERARVGVRLPGLWAAVVARMTLIVGALLTALSSH